jgi:2-polyprenyl-3-methyl-5-hydroxy-6-metoxy-1,4-benzoquinol methylase
MELASAYEEETRRVGTLAVDGRIVKAANLLRRLVPSENRFLDIGCGRGQGTSYLAQQIGASEIWGIDIAATNLESARKLGVRAVYADMNTDRIPSDDGYFNAVFCGEVLEHLVKPDHLLGEVFRVLADSGAAVFTTPNLGAWFNRIVLLLGWQPYWTNVSFQHNVGRPTLGVREGSGHLRVFTERALRELLSIHGLETVARAPVFLREIIHRKMPWFFSPLMLADAVLSQLVSLSPILVVAVRKKSEM